MKRTLFAVLIVLVLTLGVGWTAVSAEAQNLQSEPPASTRASEVDEFGARVRAYLLKHPEVLLEALQILQERQEAAKAESQRQVVDAHRDALFANPMSPVRGNPGGDVSLVEFFDYNCPYCRQVAPAIRAIEAADGNLRIVFKEFPILGSGSEFAAKAALAAQNQGKYGVFHDALMQYPGKFGEYIVLDIAREIGLDVNQLERDMMDPAIEEEIRRNRELAAVLGITGTPGFVIGDQVVPGAVDQATLQTMIQQARTAGK